MPEILCHLIAACPNGLTVEYMPWMLKLFEETPSVDKGDMILSEKPGFGLVFNQDAVKRFAA
jgi:L-talarate/galactarate dehydratase